MRLLVLLSFVSFAALADEGMWTYDNFPSRAVSKKYGFAPDAKWLDEARLSSVRLAGGCSGSFVSPDGLVMTNHHCARSCIAQLSTKDKDFNAQGFYAPQVESEVKCPEIELNQLVKMTDVTDRVQGATKGVPPGKEFDEKRKAQVASIEKECSGGNDAVRCEVVDLYHGGQYSLYEYKRFQDVRLVFAPEFAMAFFGGDPDNFNFPRYDLDVSFVRAWENGKPAHTEHYFRWPQAAAAPKEGDLTFVSGHPGKTSRELTLRELQFERDVALPERLFDLAQWRGELTAFGRTSAEHARIAEDDLFYVENSFKARRGRFEALTAPTLWNQLVARERRLRSRVNARGPLRRQYGTAWDEIAKAIDAYQPRHKELVYIEQDPDTSRPPPGFESDLFKMARRLLRGTEELQKPNEQRLPEYTDARLPELKQKLFSKAPIHRDLEVLRLTFMLTRLREVFGPDHPVVKKALGSKSPAELAQELVKSGLYDVAMREKLWQAGRDAVQASSDPMIQFVRSWDAEARAIRRWYDGEIKSRYTSGTERVASAKFAVEGKTGYPDATFTLRLTYGSVKGFMHDGRPVTPVTFIGGAFDRATGRDPFRLPDSWLNAARDRALNLSLPFDFVTTNDIIGGNSGSPVFDKDLRIVGLVFDSNIYGLGGEYGFDESVNRMIAVHASALLEALDHIYGAHRLVTELHAK